MAHENIKKIIGFPISRNRIILKNRQVNIPNTQDQTPIQYAMELDNNCPSSNFGVD
jgi:hypothetical protein